MTSRTPFVLHWKRLRWFVVVALVVGVCPVVWADLGPPGQRSPGHIGGHVADEAAPVGSSLGRRNLRTLLEDF